MINKKSDKANLENKRLTYFFIGLIVTLGIVITAFQWKTYEAELMDLGNVDLNLEEQIVPITQREQKPPPPPPAPPEVIEIVEDDIEIENEIEIDDQDFEEEEVFEIIEEPVEEVVEPMNFMVVENKPVFPGCENIQDQMEQYMCFQRKIGEHIVSVFKYPPIAKDMGIQGRVFVSFVIDEKGKVTNPVIARSVDKYLDEEALKIVKTIPQMTPAKQRGKPVPVNFTIPINFKLQ